jgi:hypothetical protein
MADSVDPKLPHFASEQEEVEFWATHDSTEYLDETEPVDVTFIDARSSEGGSPSKNPSPPSPFDSAQGELRTGSCCEREE